MAIYGTTNVLECTISEGNPPGDVSPSKRNVLDARSNHIAAKTNNKRAGESPKMSGDVKSERQGESAASPVSNRDDVSDAISRVHYGAREAALFHVT
jgi:hypothetical protein